MKIIETELLQIGKFDYLEYPTNDNKHLLLKRYMTGKLVWGILIQLIFLISTLVLLNGVLVPIFLYMTTDSVTVEVGVIVTANVAVLMMLVASISWYVAGYLLIKRKVESVVVKEKMK